MSGHYSERGWTPGTPPAADNGQGGEVTVVPLTCHGCGQVYNHRCTAPPSPDPGEVERVARALLDAHEADLDLPERWQWDDASDGVRAYFRRLARAALAAARPATDAEQKVARVEALAEELWGARQIITSTSAATRIRDALSGAHPGP